MEYIPTVCAAALILIYIIRLFYIIKTSKSNKYESKETNKNPV